MKKLIIAILLIAIAVGVFTCIRNDSAVSSETKNYEITTEVHSLNVKLNAGDVQIKNGNNFLVESNLKQLVVTEEKGVLKIIDKAKGSANYSNAKLILYIPYGFIFDTVDIESGATKITSTALFANTIDFELGAGDVDFENLVASSSCDIEGGAGKITINQGYLNNLDLNMGVGELNLTAALTGFCELEFGVGSANLNLLGSKADYRVNIQKGIGSVTVDGVGLSGANSVGNGENTVNIEGGVGSISITFENA